MARSKVLKGLDKLEARLTDPDWVQKPAGDFLRRWRDDMRRYAAEHMPVWKGEGKAEIESAQDTAKFPLYARVFSNAPQVRWMTYGTGLLSEDPLSKRQRHSPPVEALRPWAEDHGLEPYLVAKSIRDRGGIAPRRFWQDAEKHADQNFNRYLSNFARDIEHAAGSAA